MWDKGVGVRWWMHGCVGVCVGTLVGSLVRWWMGASVEKNGCVWWMAERVGMGDCFGWRLREEIGEGFE